MKKKIFSWIGNGLLFIFYALCIISIIFTISAKKNENALSIFGTQFRLVLTGSMEQNDDVDVSNYEIKSIKTNSIITVKVIDEDNKQEFYDALAIGDVVTFRYYYGSQVTITHRIISKEEKSTGGYIITLKGDNGASETGSLVQVIDTDQDETSYNYIIGKVVGVNYPLGAALTFLKSNVGILCFILIPSIILIIFEIIKIFSRISSENKIKQQKKDQELLLLKEKLKQLEEERSGKING